MLDFCGLGAVVWFVVSDLWVCDLLVGWVLSFGGFLTLVEWWFVGLGFRCCGFNDLLLVVARFWGLWWWGGSGSSCWFVFGWLVGLWILAL